jgi:hypothetical protein
MVDFDEGQTGFSNNNDNDQKENKHLMTVDIKEQ